MQYSSSNASTRRVLVEHRNSFYYEGSFIDITERLRKERAERERETAEAASQAKSQFLATMSHEIRTPMTAILGFTEILKRGYGRNTEDILRYLDTIHASGKNLLELINDILDMSKIEAGQIKVNNESMDLARLIEDINSIFQLSCQSKKISLKTETDSQLPDRIIADHGKIRQILINLMSNAVKFTSQGSITLHGAATMDGGQRWMVCIDIIDSGHGIAEDEQSRLFQAFEQTL